MGNSWSNLFSSSNEVKNVTASIKDGVLIGEWHSNSSGKFELKIKENGRVINGTHTVSKKSFSWKCSHASMYELLVKPKGENEYKSSDTVYSDPLKVGNAAVMLENGDIVVSWADLENQDVHYHLRVFKGEEEASVYNKLSCKYVIKRNLVSPSTKYKFEIWARSIHGNKDGETTSVEIIGGKIEVYYNITVVALNPAKCFVTVTYFRKDYGTPNDDMNYIFLPPECEYKTAIEGDVKSFPQYKLLRHKDLLEKGSVKHSFILERKLPESVTLIHVIFTESTMNEQVAFEWKDTPDTSEGISQVKQDSMCLDLGYGSMANTPRMQWRSVMRDNLELSSRTSCYSPRHSYAELTAINDSIIQIDSDDHSMQQYEAPSKLGNAKVTERNGYLYLSWNELKNENAHYYIDWFCDDVFEEQVHNKYNCTYKCGPISPKRKYKFEVWARFVQGKVDGKRTRVEVMGDGELNVHYHISIDKNKVSVAFSLEPAVGHHSSRVAHGYVSLPYKEVYTCMIKGDVTATPSFKYLRHEDLWKNCKVNHTFFLESKSSELITLLHIVENKDEEVDSVPFTWRNGNEENIIPNMSFSDNKYSEKGDFQKDKHSADGMSLIYALMQCNDIILVLAGIGGNSSTMQDSQQAKTREGYERCGDAQKTTIEPGKNLEIQLNGNNFRVEPSDGYKIDSTTIMREKFFTKTFNLIPKPAQYQGGSLKCCIVQDGQTVDWITFTSSIDSLTPTAGSTTNNVNASMAILGAKVENASATGNTSSVGGNHTS